MLLVLKQRLRCTDPHHGRHQNKAADAPCTSWNRGCAAPIPITDGTRTRQPTPRVRPGTEAALHRPPSRTAPEQGSPCPVYVLEQRLRCTDPHHGRHQNKAADAPCTSWNRGCAAPIPITDGTRTRQPTPSVRPGTEAALHRSPSRTAPEQGSRRPVYVLEQRLRCTDPHHGRHQNKAADAPCTSWDQSPRRPHHGRHQNKAAHAPCTSWNRGCAAPIPITDGTRTRQPTPRVRPGASLRDVPITDGIRTRQPTPRVRPGTEAALHRSPSRTASEQGSRRPVYVLEQRLRCTDRHHGRHQNKAADAPCTSWNRGCAAPIAITDGIRTRQPTPRVRPGASLRDVPITDGTRTRQPTPRVRPGASLRDVDSLSHS